MKGKRRKGEREEREERNEQRLVKEELVEGQNKEEEVNRRSRSGQAHGDL